MKLIIKIKEIDLLLFSYDKLSELYYKYLTTDEKIIKRIFKERVGRSVNLENLVKYNDKLQWLKLYWRDVQIDLRLGIMLRKK